MNVSLVLTVIGDDHPGLVEQLATTISQHQGNWLESSMSNLSGKFAGIVCVSVAEAQLAALSKALAALPGMRSMSRISAPTQQVRQCRQECSSTPASS